MAGRRDHGQRVKNYGEKNKQEKECENELPATKELL